MTFESVDSRERFKAELLSRLDSLPPDKLALFGIAACEHLRSFSRELASVTPAADGLVGELWEQAGGGAESLDMDLSALEPAIADHMDVFVGGDLEALGVQRNAGLGFGLALLATWATSRDLEILVRLATSTVAEFGEISSVGAAESAELTNLVEWLSQETSAGVEPVRQRAEAHGRELAHLARLQWQSDS